MKKIIVFILALIYITTSSGVAVNMHYCMGKFLTWDFSHYEDQYCSNCGMKETKSKGCCQNEQKILKVEDDQNTAADFNQLPLFSSPAFTTAFFECSFIKASLLRRLRSPSHALQRWLQLPLFILNCDFRI